MPASPCSPAEIAKLMSASASHVIATLTLLNHELAVLAPSELKVTQQKIHSHLLAPSHVAVQHALPTELGPTHNTDHRCFVHENVALTVLTWAKPFAVVLVDLVIDEDLVIFLLILDGQSTDDGRGLIEKFGALIS